MTSLSYGVEATFPRRHFYLEGAMKLENDRLISVLEGPDAKIRCEYSRAR